MFGEIVGTHPQYPEEEMSNNMVNFYSAIVKFVLALQFQMSAPGFSSNSSTTAASRCDLKPAHLFDQIGREITLDELPVALSSIIKGELRGRTIVQS